MNAGKSIRNVLKNRLALGGAAALIAAGLVVSLPMSASANGSYTEKLSASGCTEGDYYRTSYSSAVSGAAYANAYTSYTGMICVPFSSSSIPGARAIAGSTLGAWAYGAGSYASTRIQKASGSQIAYGHHSVGGYYARNS